MKINIFEDYWKDRSFYITFDPINNEPIISRNFIYSLPNGIQLVSDKCLNDLSDEERLKIFDTILSAFDFEIKNV